MAPLKFIVIHHSMQNIKDYLEIQHPYCKCFIFYRKWIYAPTIRYEDRSVKIL
jgi:hypothetical protein